MDWFSWLSKTGMEATLVYEYGLAFVQNELEEDDIGYFNHEFLQSMGISIAKHRLEILKLARKERESAAGPRLISRLIVAIKRTKRSLAKFLLKTWVRREDSLSALVFVPNDINNKPGYYGSRWRGVKLKRNKKATMPKPGRLLLTSGRVDSFSSPFFSYDEKMNGGDDDDDDGGYWATGVEKIRWDTMFQNMKPT